jgi:hypothetical protein
LRLGRLSEETPEDDKDKDQKSSTRFSAPPRSKSNDERHLMMLRGRSFRRSKKPAGSLLLQDTEGGEFSSLFED